MVNDRAQLYTIEGVAAGLIMILAAYFAVSSTSVYTPGDAHISDMQLEVVGTDALRMMDTPANISVSKSPLQQIVEGDERIRFGELFSKTVNNRTSTGKSDRIQYNASYAYRVSSTDEIKIVYLNSSRFMTGGEHPVRVTKWVIVEKAIPPLGPYNRAVLVEVLLWRD